MYTKPRVNTKTNSAIGLTVFLTGKLSAISISIAKPHKIVSFLKVRVCVRFMDYLYFGSGRNVWFVIYFSVLNLFPMAVYYQALTGPGCNV